MLCGKPVDSVFTYDTPTYVNIRDARLGIMHYVLLFAIAIYVVVYQVLYSGQHLRAEPPIGAVSFQIQRPIFTNQEDWWSASDFDRADTPMKFPPISELTYCAVSNQTYPPGIGFQRACRYADEDDLTVVSETSILITTRVTEMRMTKVCGSFVNATSNCTNVYQPISGTNVTSYTIQPEDFVIMLDHEVRTATTGVHGKSVSFRGAKMAQKDGSTVSVTDVKKRDVMSIRSLLEAAGMSLDQRVSGLFDANSTGRYTGVTLQVKVLYENYENWKFLPGDVRYSYSVEVGSVYKALHTTTMLDDTTRFWQNRHGVTIQVVQMGRLCSFSLLQMTVFLASALALVTIAHLVVDTVATRLLPERQYFGSAKYQGTETRPLVREFILYRKQQGLPEPATYEEFKSQFREWQQPRQDELESKEDGSHVPLISPRK